MTIELSNEVRDASGPTDTDSEIAEIGMRPDLVWDNEAPGLCIHVHGNGVFIIILNPEIRALSAAARSLLIGHSR